MKRRINTIVAGGLVLLGGAGFLGGNSGCATPRLGETQLGAEVREAGEGFEDGLRTVFGLPLSNRDNDVASPNIIYEYYGDDVYVPVNISNKSRKIDGEWYHLPRGSTWFTNDSDGSRTMKLKYDKEGKMYRPPVGHVWVKFSDPEDFRTRPYKK